jgi:hypothetical protein
MIFNQSLTIVAIDHEDDDNDEFVDIHLDEEEPSMDESPTYRYAGFEVPYESRGPKTFVNIVPGRENNVLSDDAEMNTLAYKNMVLNRNKMDQSTANHQRVVIRTAGIWKDFIMGSLDNPKIKGVHCTGEIIDPFPGKQIPVYNGLEELQRMERDTSLQPMTR